VSVRVGLIGDRNDEVVAHRAIPRAIELAAAESKIDVAVEWLGTGTIDPSAPDLARFSGLWCVPASPYRSAAGAIAAIRFAREHDVPFLGTCGGFQHAVLEIAASLWGIEDAVHAELDADAPNPVIRPLKCTLVEAGGSVRFRPGSKLANAYGLLSAEEEYHCSYGFNPRYRRRLEDGPLRLTAWDDEDDVRGVELSSHPFFVATLFQPERAALKGRTPPIVAAWLKAAPRSRRARRVRDI